MRVIMKTFAKENTRENNEKLNFSIYYGKFLFVLKLFTYIFLVYKNSMYCSCAKIYSIKLIYICNYFM